MCYNAKITISAQPICVEVKNTFFFINFYNFFSITQKDCVVLILLCIHNLIIRCALKMSYGTKEY